MQLYLEKLSKSTNAIVVQRTGGKIEAENCFVQSPLSSYTIVLCVIAVLRAITV